MWDYPPVPPRPQYLPRDHGPDGAAFGLCWGTPRHADHSTTRPFGSGPTRQSAARDSESSSTCQLPTRPGQDMFRRILRKKYRPAVGTHYWPTQIHQARYSPRHRRDGRAGTTILQRVSAFYDRTKALLSWSMGNVAASAGRNYGPDGSTRWLCRSTQRQADESTTRLSGSGQTRQSCASTRRLTNRVRAGQPMTFSRFFFSCDATRLAYEPFRAEHEI